MLTSFRFASYRDFKRSLGKINAASECTELAIRSFIDGASTSASPSAYIRQLSKDYDVKVDAVDLGALSTQIGRFHVVAVHQQFELFLREFRAEHPKSNWDKEEGDDLLKATLKNIGDGYARTAALLGRLEVDVADYYRHVRNRFVHAMEEKARMPVDAKELRGRVGESDEYNRLAAPNAYDAIRFDDFVLFTRVAKNIALQLCKVARPTDRQIFEMLGRTEEKQAVAALIRRLDRKPERLRKALATFLRSRFSLDDHEAEPIIEMITGR